MGRLAKEPKSLIFSNLDLTRPSMERQLLADRRRKGLVLQAPEAELEEPVAAPSSLGPGEDDAESATKSAAAGVPEPAIDRHRAPAPRLQAPVDVFEQRKKPLDLEGMGCIPVPATFLESLAGLLNPYEQAVYLQLYAECHRNKVNHCRISKLELSRRSGITKTAIFKFIRSLEAKGLLLQRSNVGSQKLKTEFVLSLPDEVEQDKLASSRRAPRTAARAAGR